MSLENFRFSVLGSNIYIHILIYTNSVVDISSTAGISSIRSISETKFLESIQNVLFQNLCMISFSMVAISHFVWIIIPLTSVTQHYQVLMQNKNIPIRCCQQSCAKTFGLIDENAIFQMRTLPSVCLQRFWLVINLYLFYILTFSFGTIQINTFSRLFKNNISSY